MTQNIYDDDGFFAGYSRLPRSVEGLDGAPEWPNLRAMLPDLRGRNVVDLGCGFGWFCRWAREAGAVRVLGLDLSENMLARARTDTADDAVEYRREDLERLDLPAGAFGLAYSSLTLHYLANLDGMMRAVHRALTPGGALVFSAEHPVYTAPREPRFRVAQDGRKIWPLDQYLAEGPRSTDWLAKGVVKQHRTVGTYLNMLIGVGFAIEHVEEWGPTPEQITAHPEWDGERERPAFLLVKAAKPRKE
ncbi:MAG TPA: class I SAM-dependent methyltransferase [Stellaceae bacterium]|nr:class I SAM-dependent methyltransferase [Stellaceae bacterium]